MSLLGLCYTWSNSFPVPLFLCCIPVLLYYMMLNSVLYGRSMRDSCEGLGYRLRWGTLFLKVCFCLGWISSVVDVKLLWFRNEIDSYATFSKKKNQCLPYSAFRLKMVHQLMQSSSASVFMKWNSEATLLYLASLSLLLDVFTNAKISNLWWNDNCKLLWCKYSKLNNITNSLMYCNEFCGLPLVSENLMVQYVECINAIPTFWGSLQYNFRNQDWMRILSLLLVVTKH